MNATQFLVLLLISTSIIISNAGITLDIKLNKTCLPENENNKRVVDKALTSPIWADIWVLHNLSEVTDQNIEYVTSGDNKCTELLTNYNQWIVETHPNTDLKVYTVTFHKSGDNYFVLLLLNQHPNMVVFGTSPFYILDENLNLIEGLGL